MVRLQKFLAEAGVASRRASEEIIRAGRVTVNGDVVRELGTKVDPAHDLITLDGRSLRAKRKLYIALHKPRGYVCTRSAEEDRKKIGDLLPKQWSEVFSVGRLDYDSEGLIFLTNDGDFCLKLTHPRYRIYKTYVAHIDGRVEPETLKRIKDGVISRGEKIKAEKVRLLRATNTSSVVELQLAEGKNREIRRLFESQGMTVQRLQRTQIGPIKLGELPSGKWRVLTQPEINSLLSKL